MDVFHLPVTARDYPGAGRGEREKLYFHTGEMGKFDSIFGNMTKRGDRKNMNMSEIDNL